MSIKLLLSAHVAVLGILELKTSTEMIPSVVAAATCSQELLQSTCNEKDPSQLASSCPQQSRPEKKATTTNTSSSSKVFEDYGSDTFKTAVGVDCEEGNRRVHWAWPRTTQQVYIVQYSFFTPVSITRIDIEYGTLIHFSC